MSKETAKTFAQQSSFIDIYTSREGYNLSSIAKKHSMTLQQLLSIPRNEQFKDNPDKTNIGDKVKLPTKDTTTKDTTSQDSNSPANSGEAKSQEESQAEKDQGTNDKTSDMHEVKEGEILSQIAQKNYTPTEELAADNDISNPGHIEAGQDINFLAAIHTQVFYIDYL